ncbi:hypothetical protein PAF17_08955 [Paracoccus sp. Z330]|uniref:DnaA N-terminal domain-containing protein n=1 Tax=Paracoccus onchidii TaxID=3017813 RepID=A0ABT4ZE62_9RHOB|nr:hypothetical protein [Paracoccus onchidii]MDB6177640.1 hypothetical protein [Paracoccus onchidii]
MQVLRPVGREAAAKKYDLLSAMMAYALAGDQHRQRLIMRLMSLITTRYNWQRNELTMGQREIARLWSVDERTVKRDMARLRSLGWLELKRAGVRGRVAMHGLDIERIMLDTKPVWPNIGEDFASRIGGTPEAVDTKVVPIRRATPVQANGLWGAARDYLAGEDPALFDAWIASLADGGIEDDCQTLLAPSKFHAAYVRTHLLKRLQMALRRMDGTVSVVRVIARGI